MARLIFSGNHINFLKEFKSVLRVFIIFIFFGGFSNTVKAFNFNQLKTDFEVENFLKDHFPNRYDSKFKLKLPNKNIPLEPLKLWYLLDMNADEESELLVNIPQSNYYDFEQVVFYNDGDSVNFIEIINPHNYNSPAMRMASVLKSDSCDLIVCQSKIIRSFQNLKDTLIFDTLINFEKHFIEYNDQTKHENDIVKVHFNFDVMGVEAELPGFNTYYDFRTDQSNITSWYYNPALEHLVINRPLNQKEKHYLKSIISYYTTKQLAKISTKTVFRTDQPTGKIKLITSENDTISFEDYSCYGSYKLIALYEVIFDANIPPQELLYPKKTE
ncbi:hypothetical protein K6119_03630 [Paracrocinitomix mangrovi]|uniref:hypothetical protein n=1 Tax=Paracrocinitomix mangrovi TaxID=2862509 RepID=UPI001EDC738A|nr:hypothetical protein [Paracrocinitomix mangrovi]UKN02602.1 hypothetical protein K6119_03630 [Paracrocinitomix mangrovi]